jgi:hypothetical protein
MNEGTYKLLSERKKDRKKKERKKERKKSAKSQMPRHAACLNRADRISAVS